MLLKRLANFLLICFLMTVISIPVFASAGRLAYNKLYHYNGTILSKMQIGDENHPAAMHKKVIEGRGRIMGEDYMIMTPGSIESDSEASWQAAANASLRGLTVSSTIKLNQDLAGSSAGEGPQVFAVSVKANRGESGSLKQTFSAADAVYSEDASESHFFIDQEAFTSDGTLKRYIDLVDPYSGVYIFEDSEIKGYAFVIDSLQQASNSLEAGLETAELFSPGEKSTHDIVGIMLESGLFETTVSLYTPLEEIELPSNVSLNADLVTISDIEIVWSFDSFSSYDPTRAGSYQFSGELLFPDNVTPPGRVFITFCVYVVTEEPEPVE